MRLYKYRDFSDVHGQSFDRLTEILKTGAFWCASPLTLNDHLEFIWDCDYTPSTETIFLVKEMLMKLRAKDNDEALIMAQIAVRDGLLESVARPVFEEMIEKCRNEIGLSCFATSDDNEVMWDRYGGSGNGVCIAVDVPDLLLDKKIFRVTYLERKVIHIDKLLSVFAELDEGQDVCEVALLSKPEFWIPEGEMRFVTMMQNVSVRIAGSKIVFVTLGAKLSTDNASKVCELAKQLKLTVLIRERGEIG